MNTILLSRMHNPVYQQFYNDDNVSYSNRMINLLIEIVSNKSQSFWDYGHEQRLVDVIVARLPRHSLMIVGAMILHGPQLHLRIKMRTMVPIQHAGVGRIQCSIWHYHNGITKSNTEWISMGSRRRKRSSSVRRNFIHGTGTIIIGDHWDRNHCICFLLANK